MNFLNVEQELLGLSKYMDVQFHTISSRSKGVWSSGTRNLRFKPSITKDIYDIITGDKTWTLSTESETKQYSSILSVSK